MTPCAYCQQRKGKRLCPGLGGSICSPCCGEHRLLRISCPSNCGYLDSGSDYQQKRLGEQFMALRRDFYHLLDEIGGHKAVTLFNLIEVVTYCYFQGRHDGMDAEVVTAIQSLRKQLSPLRVPPAPVPVFAAYLWREYEAFKKQNPEAISDAFQALEVLDRTLQFIADFSGKDFQSRRFLGGLIGYVRAYHPHIAEHLLKRHEPRHIMTQDQSLVSPPQS